VKALLTLLLLVLAWPALAQSAPGGAIPPAGRAFAYPMPPPERRMSWEERQRLREQVRSGNMTREEARARWREQRARHGGDDRRGRFSPEQRERLRRDVQDANRDLERR